ncbi:helix-turn-helix domain-containing protein [Micromonosporaceae bacterium Da 78-11]
MLADLLSEEAHHLYERLVAAGGRPADGSVPVPALEELIRHGLAFVTPGPGPLICAVSPITAMRRLLSTEQQNVIRAHQRIIERYAELENLERRYPAGLPATSAAGVDVLTDPNAVLTAAYDLVADAREECRGVVGPRLGELVTVAGRPGLRQRRLIRSAVLAEPEARDVVENAALTGIEFRALPELPAPMLVIDNAALIRLDPSSDVPVLLVRGGSLIRSLAGLFDLLWSRAIPLTGDQPADAPSAVQLRILRLAAAGLKDEAIARSLGRSVRWVRRHFELLEESLGATNRMTLGVAATRRGWV